MGSISQNTQCVFREKEAVGRASSQFLVAGLLTAARTYRKVAQATSSCRAQGSCNEPWADLRGAQSIWQRQQQGRCVPKGVRATTGGIQ